MSVQVFHPHVDALLDATTARNAFRVEMLMQAGADPCHQTSDGTSPIHKAALLEPPVGPTIISIMLSFGADPNARTALGLSPLHIAAMWGRVETIDCLLENGADIALKDHDDMSPLDYAEQAEERRYESIDALTRYRWGREENDSGCEINGIQYEGCKARRKHFHVNDIRHPNRKSKSTARQYNDVGYYFWDIGECNDNQISTCNHRNTNGYHRWYPPTSNANEDVFFTPPRYSADLNRVRNHDFGQDMYYTPPRYSVSTKMSERDNAKEIYYTPPMGKVGCVDDNTDNDEEVHYKPPIGNTRRGINTNIDHLSYHTPPGYVGKSTRTVDTEIYSTPPTDLKKTFDRVADWECLQGDEKRDNYHRNSAEVKKRKHCGKNSCCSEVCLEMADPPPDYFTDNMEVVYLNQSSFCGLSAKGYISDADSGAVSTREDGSEAGSYINQAVLARKRYDSLCGKFSIGASTISEVSAFTDSEVEEDQEDNSSTDSFWSVSSVPNVEQATEKRTQGCTLKLTDVDKAAIDKRNVRNLEDTTLDRSFWSVSTVPNIEDMDVKKSLCRTLSVSNLKDFPPDDTVDTSIWSTPPSGPDNKASVDASLWSTSSLRNEDVILEKSFWSVSSIPTGEDTALATVMRKLEKDLTLQEPFSSTLDPAEAIAIMCGLQESFRSKIHQFDAICNIAKKFTSTLALLGIRVLASTLADGGPTVPGVNIPGYNVFPRTSFSAVDAQLECRLHHLKASRKISHIILFGLEAHISVQLTALDLLEKGYIVHVIADATYSRCNDDRMFAFDRLRQAGARISCTESLTHALFGESNHPKYRAYKKLMRKRVSKCN